MNTVRSYGSVITVMGVGSVRRKPERSRSARRGRGAAAAGEAGVLVQQDVVQDAQLGRVPWGRDL